MIKLIEYFNLNRYKYEEPQILLNLSLYIACQIHHAVTL